MLLYDLLLDYASKDRKNHESLYQSLVDCQVFLIDNVARYWAENEQDHFTAKDYPNLAPPFDRFFMEYQHPKRMYINGETVTRPYDIRVGTLFAAVEKQGLPLGAHWVLEFHTFSSPNGRLPLGNRQPMLSGQVLVNIDGTLPDTDNFTTLNIRPEWKELAGQLYASMVPEFLAISFLHCKNVTITTPGIPKGLVRKARKRKDIDPVRYHLLEIEPMKQILRTEGQSQSTGIKQALHICRGHFKDYTRGRGLFGRFKGLYWWDSQVRGTVEKGIVVKDYRVSCLTPVVGDAASPHVGGEQTRASGQAGDGTAPHPPRA